MGDQGPLLYERFFPGLKLKEVVKPTDAGGSAMRSAEEGPNTRRFLRPTIDEPATLNGNAIIGRKSPQHKNTPEHQ